MCIMAPYRDPGMTIPEKTVPEIAEIYKKTEDYIRRNLPYPKREQFIKKTNLG